MARRLTDDEKAIFLEGLKDSGEITEYMEYLDGLRASGVTNMNGSPAYVEKEFEIGHAEANAIVGEWIRTFSDRKAAGEVHA